MKQNPIPPNRALVLATVALVVAIILPLAAVAVFGLKGLMSPAVLVSLAESVLLEYTTNTIVISMIAAAIALGLGLSGAWMIAAYDFPGRRLLDWALILPMAMPAYVLAYAYTDALDPSGWLYRDLIQMLSAIGIAFPRMDIRSVAGAGLIMGLALSPYVALLSKTAFEDRQAGSFDAARAMGLSPAQIFFRLALPLARPAWIAGLALVIMECWADYGTVAFFSVPTLSTGLFKAWFNYGDRSSAALMGMLMLIVMLLLMWFEMRSRGRAAWAGQRPSGRARRFVVSGKRALATGMFCAILPIFGFVLPAGLLLHAAITAEAVPQAGPLFYQAITTIGLGAAAVLVILPAAWICGYALRNGSSWLGRAVRIASVGYAMPGLVVAVGLLAWSGLFTELADQWLNWRVALASTGALLLGAYLTRFFVVGLGPIETGLGRITRSLDWSASGLGLSRLQVFLRVHVPLMRGAMGVAALLVFVDVVKELPATLVLRPFNLETLAVSAHHLAADELLGQAAWPSLTMAVVALIPLLVVGPLSGRSQQ